MKKRPLGSKKPGKKPSDTQNKVQNDDGEKTIVGRFTFANGDVYEGGYKLFRSQGKLVRHGRGTYNTENFESYEGDWDRDKTRGNFHVRYNNGMEYEGEVDAFARPNGRGTYKLPDGSSIDAVWKDSNPHSEISYREPSGFAWVGQVSSDTNEVTFSLGNHFWDDFCQAYTDNLEEYPNFIDNNSAEDGQA